MFGGGLLPACSETAGGSPQLNAVESTQEPRRKLQAVRNNGLEIRR